MNKTNIALGLLFFIVIGFIAYYFVATPKNPKMVYVDVIKLFNGFHFKTERQAVYEKQKSAYQGKLDTLRLHFEATERAFQKSGNKNLGVELNATAEYYGEMEQVFQYKLDSMDKKFNDEIWGKINGYVQDFGKEEGYDMVIGASGTGSLMYGNPSFDVTDDALKYINKKYEGE